MAEERQPPSIRDDAPRLHTATRIGSIFVLTLAASLLFSTPFLSSFRPHHTHTYAIRTNTLLKWGWNRKRILSYVRCGVILEVKEKCYYTRFRFRLRPGLELYWRGQELRIINKIDWNNLMKLNIIPIEKVFLKRFAHKLLWEDPKET